MKRDAKHTKQKWNKKGHEQVKRTSRLLNTTTRRSNSKNSATSKTSSLSTIDRLAEMSSSSKDLSIMSMMSGSAAWPLGGVISLDPRYRSRALEDESVTQNMSDDDESDSGVASRRSSWNEPCSEEFDALPSRPTRVPSRGDMQQDNTNPSSPPSMPRRVASKGTLQQLDTLPSKPNRVRSNPKLQNDNPNRQPSSSISSSMPLSHKLQRKSSKPTFIKRDANPKLPRRGASKTSMTRISSLLRRRGNPNYATSTTTADERPTKNFVWDHKATATAAGAMDRAATIRMKFLRNSETLSKLSRTNPNHHLISSSTTNPTMMTTSLSNAAAMLPPATTTPLNRLSSANNASISGAMSSLARMKVQSRANLHAAAAAAPSARSNGHW